jgi:hypothetical protein
MIINKHVYSFHIILLDLTVSHSEDYNVDIVASLVNRLDGSGLVTFFLRHRLLCLRHSFVHTL